MKALEASAALLLMAAAAAYLAAWVTALFDRWRESAALAAAAWVLNAALFGLNWVVAGEPPFGNMYHVMVFLALTFLPLRAALARGPEFAWLRPSFLAAAALPLVGALFMDRAIDWKRLPALQSPWFVPHVTAYLISYALATIAFFLAAARLIRKALGKAADADRYETAGHRLLRFAFPFMTFGLVSGALWADAVWGGYWSWDPKETWSLITWLLYALYFHCRASSGQRRFADTVQLVAFLALLITFLVVNLLPHFGGGLHSYA